MVPASSLVVRALEWCECLICSCSEQRCCFSSPFVRVLVVQVRTLRTLRSIFCEILQVDCLPSRVTIGGFDLRIGSSSRLGGRANSLVGLRSLKPANIVPNLGRQPYESHRATNESASPFFNMGRAPMISIPCDRFDYG